MRGMKFIGVLIALFCTLMASIMISTGSNVGGIVVLLSGCMALMSCWRYKSPKKKSREELQRVQKVFDIAQERMQSKMVISRAIIAPGGGFFIDDVNKIFAISQSGNERIINFADLVAYELNEDGNSIASGKGAATAIGGLAFGTIGALVGSSGERKHQNTCTSLIVRIMVNDLNAPQITIPYIKSEVKKDTPAYRESFENAKELVAILNYIEKHGAA